MGDSRLGGPSVVGKRYYDPEDKRQRRIGQTQAAASIAGAASTASGVAGIARGTKKARATAAAPERGAATNVRHLFEANDELKVRGGKPKMVHNVKPAMTEAQRRKLYSVSRRNAALTAGGLLGIGAATQISRHANSNRGRGWN